MIAGRADASIIRAMFWCVLFAAIASPVASLSVLAQIPAISRIEARSVLTLEANTPVAQVDVVEAR
jgi:hypothetical protein